MDRIEEIKEKASRIKELQLEINQLKFEYVNNCPPCCNKKCQFWASIYAYDWATLNCKNKNILFVTDCPDYIPCEVKHARDK